MAKRGFWTKRHDTVGEAVENAYLSYEFLKWFHPPTAAALVLGGAGGIYLGWTLFVGKGAVAIVLAVIIGAVLGAVAAVILYWLYRFFAAMG